MLTEYLTFCEDIFGGSHRFGTNSLGHKILYIEANGDNFHVNLTDKTRFGKFDLTHRNKHKNDDGKYWFHRQLRGYDLSFVIYAAYSHGLNKGLNIPYDKEDYKRFLSDWRRSVEGRRAA